jgi:hypothetical protein
MKRLLICLIGVITLYTSVQAQQGTFLQRRLQKRLSKNANENSGPVPDYSRLYYWAASPHKHDCSDSIPAFLNKEVRDSSADVFYIHPTTYISNLQKAAWNADLNDTALNKQTDLRPILYQASVFNSSCRIFAPRYRQAHLKAFLVPNSNEAKKALDLAYSDIKTAFRYYLDHENHGRPIVIASHSQGSYHAVRLMKDFFDGKPLQKQLVCAYIVGWPLNKNAFKHIPICNSSVSTGGVVGWCSYQKGKKTLIMQTEKENGICVNPLTWTTSYQWASRDLNHGAIFRDFNQLHPHAAGAGIDPVKNVLWVSLSDDWDERLKKIGNLHIIDYNLFWMNMRENVKLRIEAWLRNSNPGQ